MRSTPKPKGWTNIFIKQAPIYSHGTPSQPNFHLQVSSHHGFSLCWQWICPRTYKHAVQEPSTTSSVSEDIHVRHTTLTRNMWFETFSIGEVSLCSSNSEKKIHQFITGSFLLFSPAETIMQVYEIAFICKEDSHGCNFDDLTIFKDQEILSASWIVDRRAMTESILPCQDLHGAEIQEFQAEASADEVASSKSDFRISQKHAWSKICFYLLMSYDSWFISML